MPSVKLFWFRDAPNFGDALNEILLPHFGIPIRHCATPEDADVIGMGSILNLVPENFSGTVLGAGFLWPSSRGRFETADLRILRGRLTAERCRAPASTVLGDPGLLVRRLRPDGIEKRHTLGLVPHFLEQEDEPLRQLLRRYPAETVFIDVRNPPVEVIRAVAECEFIASSSLHGLVAADALGVPNAWIVQSDKVRGRGFKFRDYYSAFGTQGEESNRTPLRIKGDERLASLLERMVPPGPTVVEQIAKLEQVFETLTADALTAPRPTQT